MRVFLWGALFFVSCAAEHQSNRTSSNSKGNDADLSGERTSSEQDLDAKAGNDAGKGKGSKYGGGMDKYAVASAMPRCGDKYDSKFKSESSVLSTYRVQDVDHTASLETVTDMRATGNNGEATIEIKTTITKLDLTRPNDEVDARDKALQYDGKRKYSFIDGEDKKKLKTENADWQNVECGVLPTREIEFQANNGLYYLTVFDVPYPSLLAPNAAKDVYLKDIGDKKVFKDVTGRLVKRWTFVTNEDGTKEKQEHIFENQVPKVFDVEVKVVANNNDVLTIQAYPVLKATTPAAQAEEESMLMSLGVAPRIEYVIDTKLRSTDVFKFKYPYEDNEYSYTDELVYKKIP